MAQDEYEEVDGETAALTGAFAGGTAGAAGGPVGIAVGAAIGAGIGIFSARKSKQASVKARKKRNEALLRASRLKHQAKKQTDSLRSTSKNLGAATPKQNAIPTGSTPTAAVGSGISSSGTF